MATEDVRKIDGSDVTAVWCHSAQSGKRFCEQMGVGSYYEDLDEFLADPSFSLVYVATPNTLHYAHARAALLAGKDVMVEKPFATSPRQVADLMSIAREGCRFLFDGAAAIWYQNFSELCRRLDQIGPVRGVYMNMSQCSRRYGLYRDGTVTNVFDPAYFGGALYDLNVINATATCYLLGAPRDVHYQPVLGYNGIDTSGTLTLGYPGCVATLTAAKDSSLPGLVRIQGERGYVEMDQNPGVYQGVRMTVLGRDGKPQTTCIDVEDVPDQRKNMFSKIFSMVQGDEFEEAMARLGHTLQAAEVLERAWKSAELPFEED